MDAKSNVSRADNRTTNAAAVGCLPPGNDNCRSDRTNSATRQESNYYVRLCHRRTRETPRSRCDARHVVGTQQSATRRNHAQESVLPHARYVTAGRDESSTCSTLSSLSSLRKNGAAARPPTWPDVI